MYGSRLALVTLLALGLAVYAGLREARRDLSSGRPEQTQGSETSAPAELEAIERPRTIRIELESGPLGRFWPFKSRPLRGPDPLPEIDVPKGEGLW